MRRWRLVLGILAGLWAAAPAAAQQPQFQPIPAFSVDLRGAISPLKHSEATATSLGVTAADLPSRSVGVQTAATVYVFRRGGFAFGVGGEYLALRATGHPTNQAGDRTGAVIHRRLTNVSGQISINFGHQSGWSYLTAGAGSLAFDTYVDAGTASSTAASAPAGPRSLTLNFGGGARWFNFEHVAFSLDLRFYATNPEPATAIFGERKRTKIMVLSAGISLK